MTRCVDPPTPPPPRLHARRGLWLRADTFRSCPLPVPPQDDDGEEEEMDDELQDETEEEFDGDQTEPEY